MAVAIKKVTLWRTEVENKPGPSNVTRPAGRSWRRFAGSNGLSSPGRQAQGHDRGLSGLGPKATVAAGRPVWPLPRFPRCWSRATIGPDWDTPLPRPSPRPGSTSRSSWPRQSRAVLGRHRFPQRGRGQTGRRADQEGDQGTRRSSSPLLTPARKRITAQLRGGIRPPFSAARSAMSC